MAEEIRNQEPEQVAEDQQVFDCKNTGENVSDIPESKTIAVAVPTAATIWNDEEKLKKAMGAARFLSKCSFAPPLYRDNVNNCLIALEMINRTGFPSLAVLQNLYIVQGKPCWAGSFCAALINNSGLFTELEHVYVGEPGTDSFGCYATAIRKSTGKRCDSETITMKMARDEGWLNKPGSKWKTMPRQMMTYRASAFFARAYCPEVMLGMQSTEEVHDITGGESGSVVVTLEPKG